MAFWQTHWLFGRVQNAVELQAYLRGIKFERVDPRDTSQRCSVCGKKKFATRNGKVFTCQNAREHPGRAPVQLDSDLNAARNIMFSQPLKV
ncbi:MAG: transposase [Candidatus Lokiarchaeota archaeon]|nr:transposase [Candidatus Lokiarchaeota archaeon]MBD3339821.1 transposase [Candidatus Lokiarchaeota archaeon]